MSCSTFWARRATWSSTTSSNRSRATSTTVAGPNGAFLIETKHRRYEERALTRAKRQAARLHAELSVWVTPVICVHVRQRAPLRHQGVWVMSVEHLLGWLREQRGRPAGAAALHRLAARR